MSTQLTIDQQKSCANWAYGQLDYLENDSMEDLLRLKNEMGLTNFSSLNKSMIMEAIILVRWKNHLALSEDIWNDFSIYLGSIPQPISTYHPSNSFVTRFTLSFPTGTTRFQREYYPGVSSPLLVGFEFSRSDIIQCSMKLVDLLL